jgi:addiction module toxin, relE/stbE family
MKELRYTRQFKKDIKRYLNQPVKLEELKNVLEMLRNEIPLPIKYRQHSLKGEYTGCMECHIEGDFLLIWFDEENNVIALFRLGSHSELFRN